VSLIGWVFEGVNWVRVIVFVLGWLLLFYSAIVPKCVGLMVMVEVFVLDVGCVSIIGVV